MNKNLILFFIFFIFFYIEATAQRDSLTLEQIQDSLQLSKRKAKKKSSLSEDTLLHSPSRAALYSAILPGLGQAYNKKYWKIPIIYGLGGTLGYFIGFNNNLYLEFKSSVEAKTLRDGEGDPRPFISTQSAIRNRDYFKRNRELLILLTLLLHGLNVVDATVDAHLKSFDVSDELAIKIEPQLDQLGGGTFAGIGLRFILK